MLILTRKKGQAIQIGDGVKITVIDIQKNQVRIGVEAPKEVPVFREEIYLKILEENRRAATMNVSLDINSLQGLVSPVSAKKGGSDR